MFLNTLNSFTDLKGPKEKYSHTAQRQSSAVRALAFTLSHYPIKNRLTSQSIQVYFILIDTGKINAV